MVQGSELAVAVATFATFATFATKKSKGHVSRQTFADLANANNIAKIKNLY